MIKFLSAILLAMTLSACASGSDIDYGYGQFAGYHYSNCNCADDAHGGADRHGGSH